MLSAVEELEAEKNALEGRWSGDQPMLRLIHCLIEYDHIHSAFLHRNDSMDRDTLKNRNSTDRRAKTCWEMMSDTWNDPEFNPKTIVFDTEGQCDELLQEKTLEYSSVQYLATATPEKCKLKMGEMTVSLKRNIQHWESSGQGDGGNNNLNSDDAKDSYSISKPHELGDLTHRNRHALANRASFFR